MELELLEKNLREKLPGLNLVSDEPMSRHTSFRIGGRVKLIAFPSSPEELTAACREARSLGIRPFIFGNGTNLLCQDEPLNLFAVKTYDGLSGIRLTEEGYVYSESGVLLSKLASFAQKNGLTGLEFAHGIPGTLGGAVSMNAGAYGGEMKDAVIKTEYLDEGFNLKTAEGAEHGFAYRHSEFSDSDRIILGSVLKLSKGEPSAIRDRMNELSEKRRSSQPLELPSAGSAFKRPKGGYAAALIDEAGLRGYAVGGAQVSEKHTGFIVNRGGATCDDVKRLMSHIVETVYARSGVLLEPEVKHVFDS